MIGSQVGPYRVESELGSGGMGTVFLAVGENGTRVALKVVHPHLIATPGFFKRFLREAELGKQVNHENVVRTLDVDATMVDDKQVNYMVMEYVEGRSLRELLNDLGAVPETLLRELAQQTAAGLAAIQSEGIIHRDLKPENILITHDHQVRIMDLGVAKLQEASVALTREGQFAGSFLYAAPEQFTGGVVGPSSDLYSFGVILYELATGQNPFKQDDTGAVIHAHLHTVPARAVERSPDLSVFFSELIAALLVKEHDKRIDSARFVCELLAQGESSDWWADRVTTLRAIETPLPNIRVRRETEVHGRDKELAQLNDAWERAKQGLGTTLLLEGEAGIGKTRLLDAFLKSLQGQEAHVLYGSYPPSGGLGGLSEAVIGKFGEAGLEQTLEPYLTVTPSLVPAFASLIKHESPPTGIEPLQGDALQSVCCHLLRALATEKPTIWIVEDMHFSPADSWNLLLALARAAGDQRNLIILSARPGLSEDVLTHLSRLENFERLNLERLGAREIIELLRDAFKSEALATKLGGTIAYKSDGVPFFIFELVRSLKEGSLLRKEKDGSFVQTEVISDIEVPSAVKDLIESRLRGLSKEERAILDLGAVQGYEFDPDLVGRVRGLKRIQVLETLADLERRAGIVRGGAGVCRFDQYQIHEVLLQNLMPDLRAEYHTLLADEFAKREEIDEETEVEGDEALFLATHHLQGSTPRAARPFLDRALDHLERAGQHDQAIELAQRALATRRLVTGKDRAVLLLRMVGWLALFGRREDQHHAIDEAERLAEELSDQPLQTRVQFQRGSVHSTAGEQAEAQRCFKMVIDLATAADDRQTEMEAKNQLGISLWYVGRFEEMRVLLEEALRTSEDPIVRLRATSNLGLALWDLGHYEDASQNFETVLETSRSIGHKLGQIIGLDNLAAVQTELGAARRATELLTESRVIAKEIGDRVKEAYSAHRLGDAHAQAGDAESAVESYRAALALRRETQYPNGEAESLLALGRLTEDRDYLERAVALGREIDRPYVFVLGAAYLALHAGGDAGGAVEVFEEFESRLRHQDKLEARMILFKVTGDRAHLEAAHALLEHGREHAPAEFRDSMVENVPLNREIMEAWNA